MNSVQQDPSSSRLSLTVMPQPPVFAGLMLPPSIYSHQNNDPLIYGCSVCHHCSCYCIAVIAMFVAMHLSTDSVADVAISQRLAQAVY